MDCYGYPGGIGTASRLVEGYTVGVLLLCNFGDRDYLDLLEGAPTGDARPGAGRLLHRRLHDRRAAVAAAAAAAGAAAAARARAHRLLRLGGIR